VDPYAQLGFGLFDSTTRGKSKAMECRLVRSSCQQTQDVSSLIEPAQNSEDEGRMNAEKDDVNLSFVAHLQHISSRRKVIGRATHVGANATPVPR
jgi:hypothetical protein